MELAESGPALLLVGAVIEVVCAFRRLTHWRKHRARDKDESVVLFLEPAGWMFILGGALGACSAAYGWGI